MDFIKLLKAANHSRTLNGIVFDGDLVPLGMSDLENEIQKVSSGKGLDSYYLFNEELNLLTKYVKKAKGIYKLDEDETTKVDLSRGSYLSDLYDEKYNGLSEYRIKHRVKSIHGAGTYSIEM